jgi:hypothetical protein
MIIRKSLELTIADIKPLLFGEGPCIESLPRSW